MELDKVGRGLYMWNPDNEFKSNNIQVSSYSFLTLFRTNKENFTPAKVKQADLAKELYMYIGPPGYNKFIRWIATNYIRKIPVIVNEAKERYTYMENI